MNSTEVNIIKTGKDFYEYRLGLQIQAVGSVIIVCIGLLGKELTRMNILIDANLLRDFHYLQLGKLKNTKIINLDELLDSVY